jgi:hypothetical protein
VAAVAGLTWWHARYDWFWMKAMSGYGTVVIAALYVGLSIGGALWTLSLIRPLFSGLRAPDDGTGLSRLDEPALFAFVDRLADKIGCPRPDIIRLNLDVNASAYYETSFFGLRRRAFTLTLGLPLVGGLTLTQLAGVIAHELGHFAQRGSGFLDRFIKRVNLWFALPPDPARRANRILEPQPLADGARGNRALASRPVGALYALVLDARGTDCQRIAHAADGVRRRLLRSRRGRLSGIRGILPAAARADRRARNGF